ncbi:vWA domain-containing protein [Streptomyces sp. NPDC093085]|uniref:vWA domain-containing protein n=1 Tax=Streptomyces sp. NPDC093085 TaxID=3155068 RepID=UPI003442514F
MDSTSPTPTRPAGTRRLAAVLLALAGLIAVTGAAPGQAFGVSERATTVTEGADPIDFAVLVDLSKSLSAEDITREVEAAALIAQGEISDRSRVTVIGFGSSEKPGQSPVFTACDPTVVDATSGAYLDDCVKKLSRGRARMGPGTDFPAGLRQALTSLTKDASWATTPKVVFLLTDGKLDVRDSPEYGADAASRQAEATRQLREQLTRARENSVQIWPLGFGSAIDRTALKEIAEGGFRNGCADLPSATPRLRVTDSAAGIDRALQETFAAARCAQVVQGEEGKPPTDLKVTIPKIATDGSITVSKHDPKVRATYYDPRGRKVEAGDSDGSAFAFSGQNGSVEALRVTNPRPGTWTVRLDAPEGHQGRDASVRAIWQGRLRSSVILDPPSPRPGEKTTVEVRMQTRRGVIIDDPEELKGIKVAARLSGSGFAPLSVPLTDDGKGSDARAGDARFTGTLTVPSTADGALALTADMSAPGVTSDHRPFNARIATGPPPATGRLTVDPATVHPGGSVTGVLEAGNRTGKARTVRLALADQPAGAQLTITPAETEIPPGATGEKIPFRITVSGSTEPGRIGTQVTAADTTDGETVLDSAFLDLRVDPVPTWWDRWWWAVAGAGALLLALAGFLAVRRAAWLRRRDLAGVRLELRGEGIRPDELTVRTGQSPGGEFHLVVERARGSAPSLQRGRGGAAGYRLRRTASGEFLLRPPHGRERSVRAGEPTALGDGLELIVHDRRSAPTGPGGSGRARSGDRTRGAAPGRNRAPGRGRAEGRTEGRAEGRTDDRADDRAGTRVRPPRTATEPPPAAPAGEPEQRSGARRFDPNF